MTALDERLLSLQRMLKTWTPENGFKATNLRFTVADIIFGRRVAAMLRQTPSHSTNTGEVIAKIRREAQLDEKFESWLLQTSVTRLRDVVEFSYFRLPPNRSSAA